MKQAKRDYGVMFGVLILGAAIFVFLLVVKCRPDFFRDVTLLP